MDPAQRVVTCIPLAELWNCDGPVGARRLGPIDEQDIVRLLRDEHASFVVADIGCQLTWVPPANRFTSWKGEVKARLAAPNATRPLDEYPNGYCYFATLWRLDDGRPVIVLEKHH
jgi:hypothetical protein